MKGFGIERPGFALAGQPRRLSPHELISPEGAQL
jgi:hypothetical protein